MNAIVSKNDFYFTPKNITKNLKKIVLSSKKEDNIRKLQNIVSPSSKYSFLNEQKHLIEKSILNMTNSEAKLFKNQFNKSSAIYKRFEYSKKYDEYLDGILKQKKNQKLFSFAQKDMKIPSEELKQFDEDYFLSTLNDSKK